MPWSRGKDFLRHTAILHFLPPNYLLFRWRGGSWNLWFLVSLPYRCYTPNLVKTGLVVLEKKMLTHDARLTADDDGRQPIALGHLSDSGDLKMCKINRQRTTCDLESSQVYGLLSQLSLTPRHREKAYGPYCSSEQKFFHHDHLLV